MVNFEKLCDVYASDLAKGGNAKDPREEDVIQVDLSSDETQQTSPAVGAGDVETKDDNNKPSTGKQGCKRVHPESNGLEARFVGITKSLEKFLESEKENANTMNGYCGAHVAVEAFESRARILNAKENQPFPTLDALAAATTAAARQRVRDKEAPFEILRHTGVVSKEDYDAAAPNGQGFTRNVQGLKHYRIQGHRVYYIRPNNQQQRYRRDEDVKDTVDEIASHGPVYAWFVPNPTFSNARHGIYHAPPATHKSGAHAILLYGFGARGRRTSAMFYQNNWGRHHHVNGRGLIESNSIVAAIVPRVEKNW
ncbi:hypothetical protein BS78_06G247000 [Paspalum vaginatum]|nr:hypothetical protein BS78_06G247000 [Paspalum vaginatum]